MNGQSTWQGEEPQQILERVTQTVSHCDALIDDNLRDDSSREESLISFVIPVKDEESTIAPLAAGIDANVPTDFDYEIVFIDDGSSDRSWEVIRRLSESHPTRIRGIRFRHNAGKATSLEAGFQAARGNVVFTMDADLQDDPQEIPRFLAKLDEGFDLVCGWKRVRHDPWHKVLPSRVFNFAASLASQVNLHDHNCGFKCYRRELIERVELFGELHRVIPSLAGMQGFQCTEIEVRHHPRTVGRSKYGMERILRGLCDLSTTGFLLRFRQRPSHFFNAIAGLQLAFATLALLGSVFQFAGPPMSGLLELTSGAMFAVAGTTFLAGLLAELIIRGPIRQSESLPIQSDTGILLAIGPSAQHSTNCQSGSVHIPHERDLAASFEPGL